MSNEVIQGPILVTGGAGYIGSHAVYALLDRGVEVVILDNLSTGFRQVLPQDIKFIEGNAGNEKLIHELLVDYSIAGVMHFAGSIVMPESVTDPLTYYQNNTVASRSLISACVSMGVSNFIFSSTGTVYGQPDKLPVNENALVHPETPYSRSKLMTEWILEDVSNSSNLNYAALRYFNVAGADPNGRTGQCSMKATHLIKIASEVAIGRRPKIEIYGDDYNTPDGSCIRDYIHVSDVADAHLEVLNLLQKTQENYVLNCGYGIGVSVKEVVSEFKKVTGKDLKATIGPRRNGDVAELVSDSTLLKEQTGWCPKHANLRDIITSSLSWEMQMDSVIRKG